MSDRRSIVLHGPADRDRARDAIGVAPRGYEMLLRPAKRSLSQNAIFHSLCDRLAHSTVQWSGKTRSAEEWKFLLISAHSVITNSPGELLLGLENERVMLRESSAAMSKERATSLIDYTIAFMTQKGVDVGGTPNDSTREV